MDRRRNEKVIRIVPVLARNRDGGIFTAADHLLECGYYIFLYYHWLLYVLLLLSAST